MDKLQVLRKIIQEEIKNTLKETEAFEHPIATRKTINPDLNHVKRIYNVMGWKKPYFIDRMKKGYRTILGEPDTWSANEFEQFKRKLKKLDPNIPADKLVMRVRGGYGPQRGFIDLITPYAQDEEVALDFIRK